MDGGGGGGQWWGGELETRSMLSSGRAIVAGVGRQEGIAVDGIFFFWWGGVVWWPLGTGATRGTSTVGSSTSTTRCWVLAVPHRLQVLYEYNSRAFTGRQCNHIQALLPCDYRRQDALLVPASIYD